MIGTRMQALAADESGATAIEYGLIVAVIGLALVTVISSIGPELTRIFQTVQAQL